MCESSVVPQFYSWMDIHEWRQVDMMSFILVVAVVFRIVQALDGIEELVVRRLCDRQIGRKGVLQVTAPIFGKNFSWV